MSLDKLERVDFNGMWHEDAYMKMYDDLFFRIKELEDSIKTQKKDLRAQAAIAAMQAFISHSAYVAEYSASTANQIAANSILCADALLKKLEEE